MVVDNLGRNHLEREGHRTHERRSSLVLDRDTDIGYPAREAWLRVEARQVMPQEWVQWAVENRRTYDETRLAMEVI